MSHKYPPGSMLDRETVLAEHYGVARDTLRGVLSKLEEESLLRRVRGTGTFVSERIERPKLTFLLPCAECMADGNRFLTDVLQGVIDFAHRNNADVETPAVSPTNNPEDIDWSRLYNCDQSSRVVVFGHWFGKVFPFLEKSGCRTVFIGDNFISEEYSPGFFAKSAAFINQQDGMIFEATVRLLEKGCRKPLLIAGDLERPNHPWLRGYCEAMKRAGLEPLFVNISDSACANAEEWRNLFSTWRKTFDFDGFLTGTVGLYRALHGLRTELPNVICSLPQLHLSVLNRDTIYTEFPLVEIGRLAAETLLSKDWIPVRRPVKAEFFNWNGNRIPHGVDELRQKEIRR